MEMEKKRQALLDWINACPYAIANNVKAMDVGSQGSRVAVELTHASENIWGIPHGGLLYTISDIAAGVATQYYHDGRVVTASGSMSFLYVDRDAKQLEALAKVTRRGKTLAFVGVEVFSNNGIRVAKGDFIMHLSLGTEGRPNLNTEETKHESD